MNAVVGLQRYCLYAIGAISMPQNTPPAHNPRRITYLVLFLQYRPAKVDSDAIDVGMVFQLLQSQQDNKEWIR
jgi:hypothetical protein